MFKFYFDDIEVNDPINWDTFSETLEHDDEIKGVLPKYELKLSFNGKAYDVLYRKKFQINGYCTYTTFKALSTSDNINYTVELEGLIYTKDCRFFLNKGVVETDVEDNNYGAKIHNNKSIKVCVNNLITKNNQVLTPVPETPVYLFNPVDGNLLATQRKCYYVYDCFRFIVDFVSDNSVGFESNYLQDGFLEQAYITTGSLLRRPTDTVQPPSPPIFCFKELFNEINKKYPIAFTVVTRSGKPTIKIENIDYFYSQNRSGVVLRNVDDLEQYFNNEVLYSNVKFGGPSVAVDLSKHHFTYDKFRSFKEEEYFFAGTCNIDKALDLVGEWVADSNIIEEITVTDTSNSSYDDNIFFIQQVGGFAVKQSNPLTLADPYYYNPEYTNDSVSYHHKSLEFYLQDNIYGFRAALSADQITGVGFPPPPANTTDSSINYLIKFNNDSNYPNYDLSNTYNTSTWKFTAPIAGAYTFDAGISFVKDSPNNPVDSGQRIKFHVVFNRKNSGGTFIESVDNLCGSFDFDGTYSVRASGSFNMAIGDTIHVDWYIVYERISSFPLNFILNILYGSWFRNISSPIAVVRPDYGINKPYTASTLKFKFPISKQKYDQIKMDLSKSIIINNGDGRDRECWIRRIERNFKSGMADCEMITDIQNR